MQVKLEEMVASLPFMQCVPKLDTSVHYLIAPNVQTWKYKVGSYYPCMRHILLLFLVFPVLSRATIVPPNFATKGPASFICCTMWQLCIQHTQSVLLQKECVVKYIRVRFLSLIEVR